jgi:hypothetical protein
MPIKTLVTSRVSLRDGTLKHLSNSILEPHHIDALLLLWNPIAFAFAFAFSFFLLCVSAIVLPLSSTHPV